MREGGLTEAILRMLKRSHGSGARELIVQMQGSNSSQRGRAEFTVVLAAGAALMQNLRLKRAYGAYSLQISER